MVHESGAALQPETEQRVVAAIGYLPAMFFLPLLAERHDRFVRGHARQSLIVFGTFIAAWIAIWALDVLFGRVVGSVLLIGFLFKTIAWVAHNVVGAAVSLAYAAAIVGGIVNAAQGREWTIPYIGRFVDRLPV